MTTQASEVRTAEPMPVDEALALAPLLQTLDDPTRLRILTALETACLPVTAIVEATGIRQPTVSHHLRILRDRGLVRGERRGGYVYYCLTTGGALPLLAAADQQYGGIDHAGIAAHPGRLLRTESATYQP